MKVKDLVKELLDKDPDDEVEALLTVKLCNKNEATMQIVTLEPLVEGVKPGNTPVLLEVDATVYVNVTAEMY